MEKTAVRIQVLKDVTFAIPVFATTLLISSTLLFLIQPMVGKMVLPLLGGTPAVWNTCMVFFQTVLLAGYFYAHVISTRFTIRRQVTIHLVLLFLPLLILPIDFNKGSTPPTDVNPTVWLLGRLLLSVGLPFFVISTSAPLLQKWFSGIGHLEGRDPYFLYATSNLGSLTALLAYPLLVERIFPLTLQSQIWTQGYIVLIVMISFCAIIVWRTAKAGQPTLIETFIEVKTTGELSSKLTVTQRLWWIFLAFVPSSLMLGVTTHITTDLAPLPLLWVIPLAIYLLTFIFVFARKPPVSHRLIVYIFPFIFLPLLPLVALLDWFKTMWLIIPAHLFLFFTAAILCHGELAQRRPVPKYLTEFYLLISIGGVLGGVFNAIIAPLVFNTVTEYMLGLVLTGIILLVVKRNKPKVVDCWLDVTLPVGIGLLSFSVIIGMQFLNPKVSAILSVLLLIGLIVPCLCFKTQQIRFGMLVGALILIAANYSTPRIGNILHVERNFFGVKKIILDPKGKFHKFSHGNTLHGIQHTDLQLRREPLSYYHRTGPLGDVFNAFNGSQAKPRIAMIGLGIGSMASYAEPGQHLTFYEIDPDVVRIASNTKYFTFLTDCRGTYDVVLGDGRLQLGQAPDRHYGMIILDAFSSDSIPTHLLSREAFELYLNKLDQGGILVFHVSNRYLNLTPVVGNLAYEKGLICLSRFDNQITEEEKANGKTPANYVIMAQTMEDLGTMASNPKWKPVPHQPGMALWTDQYSNILSLLQMKKR